MKTLIVALTLLSTPALAQYTQVCTTMPNGYMVCRPAGGVFRYGDPAAPVRPYASGTNNGPGDYDRRAYDYELRRLDREDQRH